MIAPPSLVGSCHMMGYELASGWNWQDQTGEEMRKKNPKKKKYKDETLGVTRIRRDLANKQS